MTNAANLNVVYLSELVSRSVRLSAPLPSRQASFSVYDSQTMKDKKIMRTGHNVTQQKRVRIHIVLEMAINPKKMHR